MRIVGETINILILYDLVQESLNMKDKHDRFTYIETEVEDQNKLILTLGLRPDDHLYSISLLAIFLTIHIVTTVSGQRFALRLPDKTFFSSSCTPCFNPPAPIPPPSPRTQPSTRPPP